ncbi:MAG: hypothetical protein ACOC9Y_05885 [Chloroflexota bacterium]
MERLTGRQVARIALLALQALALTIALGALLVRSDDSIEGLLGGQIDLSYLFIAGFAAGLLMGITLPIPKVLFPVTFLMCLGAASAYVALLFAPTWEGVTVRTGALETFATTRALLYLGLTLVPTWLGALFGNLGSDLLGRHGEILPPHDRDDQQAASWWERRHG